MIKNKLIKKLFGIIILLNSCTSPILEVKEGTKKIVLKADDDKWVVMNIKDNKPFGQFTYLTQLNQSKKLEWYSGFDSPYYSIKIDDFDEISSITKNFKYLDTTLLSVPIILTRIYKDSSFKIIVSPNYPIDQFEVTAYYPSIPSFRFNYLENKYIISFNKLFHGKSVIYLKFEFIGEKNEIIKTLDSVNVIIPHST
ncbi:MAG: hypothetical protein JNL75_06600 [Chitinophagales bacterium]|nr:hypothetical protein [Chitinophagales bacterium]